MKRVTAILMTICMLLALAACGNASTLAASGESVTVGDTALRPEGEAGKLYENGGLKLMIPLEYDELLLTETPKKAEGGMLFNVSEKASLEASGNEDGAGWLFGISRIDESAMHEMLCYDMSGMELFANDSEGYYYVFNHPTDVRFVRENSEAMARDQEQWNKLTEWAWESVRAGFLAENPQLSPASFGNSELEMFLARVAYQPDVNYSVSTTQYGPLTPESGSFDALPYVERLSSGLILDRAEGEAPDGEYVVLSFPDEDTRFDFFKAEGGENLVRMVWNGDNEALWQLSYTDPAVKASEIMQEWYDALAEAMDVHDLAGMTLGGWTLSEDGAVTEEALNAFNKASGALLGVNYTPVALLGTQLVSGTNYSLLCEASAVTPNAPAYYAVVTVYESLEGETEIRNIVVLDLGDVAESGQIRNSDLPQGKMLGGWTVDRNASVEVEDAVLHLGSQLVSGTNHCVLCKGWVLNFVYEDLEGKTEIKQSVPVDVAALSEAEIEEIEAPAGMTLGGWSLTEDGAMSGEAQKAFEKAMEGFVGVNYTPVALLGTQLVSGTNYCLLCEAAVVYPDAKPYYAVVTVYENLEGAAEIRNIVALDLGDIAESGEIRPAGAPEGELLGGWSIDRDSYLEVPDGVMHLATQVAAGTNHIVLCKGWNLCFAAADTQGKTEITRTVPLDLAALSQAAEAD